MKVSIVTLGCKTNQAESFSLESALKKSGHEIVELSEDSDICIINTCTVTAKADYQSRQLLHKAVRNNAKIIVTGCYAELNSDKIQEFDESIILVRNKDKTSIVKLLDDKIEREHAILPTYPRHRPIVKVQDGCNYTCSYCAIPKARGHSTSIAVEEVVNEICSYQSMGYNEVVLTGIHLGTYGFDLPSKKNLSYLLRRILEKTTTVRIRLSSLEVREITDELIDLMSDLRICSHLHIPIQSGDDAILKLMNRHYTTNDFTAGMERILKHVPDMAIGTDLIVGFPCEGEKEFDSTRHLIESLPFSYLHVFPYSIRPGTRASSFSNQVSEEIKKYRVMLMRKVGNIKRESYIRNNVDRVLKTVIETESPEGIMGTTDNYIKVLIRDSKDIHGGMLANIRITGLNNGFAVGVPIRSSELANL